uniref:Uncharacterized protein n=1 Tax=Acrobeloides nanus TaxID=290746 RepID=A0A914DBA3_9BILA
RVVFNIVNFSKNRNLFDSANAAPVFRVGTEGNWSRIAARHIFYYRSQAHGDRFILSFVHIFRSIDRTEFAYCIPYSYTKLQKFLMQLESRHLPFFKRNPLTETVVRKIFSTFS